MKSCDDYIQNNDNTDTTSPTYKPVVLYLQCLENKNMNTSYA